MPTKTIDVTIPHRLTRDEARSRIQQGAERLRAQFGGQATGVHESWQDYHAEFAFTAMGQSISGRMDVLDESVKLSVDVPWMLALLAGKIKGRVEEEGRKLLEKK